MKNSITEAIANELSCRDYYQTVYYGFIVEAVENTLNDLEEADIDEIDRHIRRNYI